MVDEYKQSEVETYFEEANLQLNKAEEEISQPPTDGFRKIEQLSNLTQKNVRGCQCVSPRLVRLSCNHEVCARCFQGIVLNEVALPSFSTSSVKCPMCSSLLSEYKLFSVFGGEHAFQERVAAKLSSDQTTPTFICEACQERKRVEGSLTLDCNHRFCVECMKDYLQNCINTNRVQDSDLRCPKCPVLLYEAVITHVLPDPEYQRLITLREKLLDNPHEGEVRRKCPLKTCGYTAFMSVDEKIFRCEKCRALYCLTCKAKVRSNHVCMYAPSLREEHDKREAQRVFLKESRAKKCPVCREEVFKEDGCNFMGVLPTSAGSSSVGCALESLKLTTTTVTTLTALTTTSAKACLDICQYFQLSQ
eukprot:CAMPEP_0204920084 /NCGR_PEP_ID=MMETSP1397-20131031/17176_1 /ASSEMBLY_ACC=CAM_ASM_000891 /TAXON_ID=49980 /ORGANISM="Climacostomum Climacostomum virens, Strain Stock W-24" /LENGTH=361 /DNA_ID=CAMNT_0052093739 /DNA_START=1045 /DNA_END=2128 /DNA_ORIENTATION=-